MWTTRFTGWAKRLAAVSVIFTLLTACGGGSTAAGGDTPALPSEDPKEPVTVKMVGYWDTTLIQPSLDAFAKAHPNIKVQYESVKFDELSGVIGARMQGGSGDVDIFTADQPMVASWTAKGYAADLEKPFGASKSKFPAPVLEANEVDGKLRAMPLSTSTWMLYYNKKLLDQAGIPHPSADPDQRMTWEQITADAKKAQQSGAKYGLFFDYADKMVMMLMLTNSAGGGNGLKGTGNLEADVTNPGWQKSMNWYRDVFAQGVGPRGVTWQQGAELFTTGQVAYLPSGPWQIAANQKANMSDYGIAPMPMFEGGKAVSANGAWSLALNPNSKNKEASLIFMNWMGLEGGGQYIQTYPRLNVPATSELLKVFPEKKEFQDPAIKESFPKLVPSELEKTSVTRPKTVAYVEYENIAERRFADIRNGAEVGATLQNLSRELDEAFKKYR